MNKKKIAEKIVSYSVLGASTWVCLQLILMFGVEKKSLFQMFVDILGGGTAGALAGLAFFLVFGAIGLVSGAIYGAVGLFSLMLGGALCGLGLGSLVHIARNPDQYNFNWWVILPGIFFSYFVVRFVTCRAMDLYKQYGPSIIDHFRKKGGEADHA
jgi:hypothetical protein